MKWGAGRGGINVEGGGAGRQTRRSHFSALSLTPRRTYYAPPQLPGDPSSELLSPLPPSGRAAWEEAYAKVEELRAGHGITQRLGREPIRTADLPGAMDSAEEALFQLDVPPGLAQDIAHGQRPGRRGGPQQRAKDAGVGLPLFEDALAYCVRVDAE
jgi:hypothetical protein